MTSSLHSFMIGGAALAALAFAAPAFAQPAPPQPYAAPPPPRVPAARSPLGDLQRLSAITGTVSRFTLTPRGDLDGFLLADGTQVHLPPHLSAQLAAAVRPGDPVTVRGYRSPAVPLVVAADVTDTATNLTVADQGAPPLPPGAPAPGAQQTSLNGKVQTPLYGPAGDVNGAVLNDGTIIRLPPPVAAQSPDLLVPGQTIAVQGFALNTAYGRVIDAQTVGPPSPQVAPAAPAASPGLPPRPPGP